MSFGRHLVRQRYNLAMAGELTATERQQFIIAALFLVLAVLAFLPSLAEAADFGPYPIRVARVLDGDTLEIEAAPWPGLIARAKLRLAGVNAPELHGAGLKACELEAARRAKKFVEDWLFGRGTVGEELTVVISDQDKYGRLLGSLRAGSDDLAEALLAAGLARRYAGEKRKPWC